MKASYRAVLLWGVATALIAGERAAAAYPTWSESKNTETYCRACHGDFNAGTYLSLADGVSWGTDLMSGHLGSLGVTCDTCHYGNGKYPVYTYQSNGELALAPIGCTGCHGRAEDNTVANPSYPYGSGAGLRQHHVKAGITICTTCHADANSATYSTVPESVLPPFYGNTTYTSIPADSCSPAGSEAAMAAPNGLDNDGNGQYDAGDWSCSPACGNWVLDSGETCDPPGDCPTTCSDSDACTADVLLGSASSCNAYCTFDPITQCADSDGCCPTGCNQSNDSDCAPVCGNSVVEPGETCDPPASCPTCDDGDACTTDTTQGSAPTCDLTCTHTAVTACSGGDGCCPAGCNANNDSDCSPVCGNSVQEPGETCDPASACPACGDGDACTIDVTSGSPSTCDVTCSYPAVTACTPGDGCCPSGCNAGNDSDCSATCGNLIVEPGETCDPPAACPVCDDGNACTIEVTQGSPSTCDVQCVLQGTITTCTNNDGCCPAGCTAANDKDCSASCGNGSVEPGETCDPPSSCPSSCDDGDACTTDSLAGSAANCTATCQHSAVLSCIDADGCCPSGCNANTDSDCAPVCGNNVLESGESCDPPGSCPSSCDDGDACTADALTGNAAQCTAVCTFTAITSCTDGDGCCAAGCNANNDNDCTPACGNGVVEAGETCDLPATCPTSCDDGNACTTDWLTGAPSSCTAACASAAITSCVSGDGCCAPGCTALNDSDCAPVCGNGVIEAGESCDPPGSCPTSCDDSNACTTDALIGSAANCTAQCTFSAITSCTNGDGCCAPGCNANTDDDCSPLCGNQVVEAGETCDPAGSCPACDDGNACTIESMTGSPGTCDVVCSVDATITTCTDGDGCCPDGCSAAQDTDCSYLCGNDTLDAGETCDPPSSCPASCDDGDACTTDTLLGSASVCNAHCDHAPVMTCVDGDGCCPDGCHSLNDDDCAPACGNGVVEAGESCDPAASCPTSCDDGDACTTDLLAGSASSCNAECRNDPVTTCVDGDGCCPASCSPDTDSDCRTSKSPAGGCGCDGGGGGPAPFGGCLLIVLLVLSLRRRRPAPAT